MRVWGVLSSTFLQVSPRFSKVEKVELFDMENGVDITEFYFDYVNTNYIEEKCLEDARDKYNDN